MLTKQLCPVPEGSDLKPIYGRRIMPSVLQIALLGRNHRTQERLLMDRFGDAAFMKVLGRNLVLMGTPEAAEAIAINRDKKLRSSSAWGHIIGSRFQRGLLLMDFDEHRLHRSIMQQAFTNTRLQGYMTELASMLGDRVREIPVGEIRMADELKAIILDVALEVFVGVKLSRAEADRVNSAFGDCLDSLLAVVRYPVPGGRWARGVKGRRELEKFFYDLIPTKRATETPDLFSVLCHAKSEDGDVFTDEDVVNHMIFMLFAAHDTSAATISAMAFYMAAYPEWQSRARETAFRLPPVPAYADLAEMCELDLILREAARLNPPVPGMFREVLSDTVIDGHLLPAGTLLMAATSAVQTHRGYWSDPSAFDPERFAPDRAEDKKHRFAWMPFGGGVHKCIGLYFSQMEIKTIMHALLREYEWSVAPGAQWHDKPGSLGEPRDGLRVTIRRHPEVGVDLQDQMARRRE